MGAFVGLGAWYFLVGPLGSVSLNTGQIAAGKNLAGLLLLLSFVWTPLAIALGRSPGGTVVTGFMFGFAFGYDLPLVLFNLSLGLLPQT
jgi:hypothetical protein